MHLYTCTHTLVEVTLPVTDGQRASGARGLSVSEIQTNHNAAVNDKL